MRLDSFPPLTAALVAGLSLCCAQAHAFTFTVNYTDAAGQGFTDTTPASPVGGNTGITLGEQRRQAFEFSLQRWAQRLQSNVPIVVMAGMPALRCGPSSGILGQAGPLLVADFPGARQMQVFYPLALARALQGSDVAPGVEDIDASFNVAVDSDPNCLGSKKFYYGLDQNPGSRIDFINVVIHELGHGLGFTSLIDPATGALVSPSGYPAVFDELVFDETTTMFLPAMTDAQRAAAARNTGNLVLNGARTNSGSSFLTAGRTALGHARLYAPNPAQSGSSISHWDSVALPGLVMQPFYAAINASQHVDLTTCAFLDLGWSLIAPFGCPDIAGSDNTAPTISQLANQAIDEDGATGALAFTIGDAETPATSLIVSAASSNTMLVPGGNILLGGSGASRSIAVVPAANQFGSAGITYSVSDGSATSSRTFVVTVNPVNDAPTLDPIGDLSLPAGAGLQTVSLSGISAGPNENQSLTISASSSNPALIPNPGISYSSPSSVAALSFTPAPGQRGSSTITVAVIDDSGTANGGVDRAARSFTVTVNGGNHAPLASDDAAAASANSGEMLIDVLANDSDADGDPLTITALGAASHGGAVAPRSGGTRVGYTPARNFTGTETFGYTISDGRGGTASAAVTVTVTAPPPGNRSPIANADSFSVNQDSGETFLDVLANDSDPDGDALTITTVGTPVRGSVALQGGRLGYTPVANSGGSDSFTYSISDGRGGSASATVTVITGGVNHAPTLDALPDPPAIPQDSGTHTIGLGGIGAGAGETQVLTVTATSSNPGLIPNPAVSYASPGSSGTLSYTPLAGRSGSATIGVTVSDDGGAANGGINQVTRSFNVTVTRVAPHSDVSGAATAGDGGGKGGSWELSTLLALVLLGGLRRRLRLAAN